MNRRTALVWLAASPIVLLAKERPWKEGHLVSVDIKDFPSGHNKMEHRYLCTVNDGEFNYVVEFEKPLKLAVNDPVKFETDKDNLVVVDADGKKRSARIEKREHVR